MPSDKREDIWKTLFGLCNSQGEIMFPISVWSLQIFAYDLLRRIQFIKSISVLKFFDKMTLLSGD